MLLVHEGEVFLAYLGEHGHVPSDERWIGENPIAHGPAAQR